MSLTCEAKVMEKVPGAFLEETWGLELEGGPREDGLGWRQC
jgi:hypothetical protein